MTKQSTIFLTPHGSYSVHECEGYKPIAAYFLHTRIQGDFNRITYSNKKLKGKRNETRSQYYFIPNGELTAKDESNLKRGARFFSIEDGFLFGAYIELDRGAGAVVKIEIY